MTTPDLPPPANDPADTAWPPPPTTPPPRPPPNPPLTKFQTFWSIVARPVPAPPSRLPLTNAQLFWGVVGRMTLMSAWSLAALGTMCGLFVFVVGALVGLPLGAAIGLLLGFPAGLILGAVALRCFRPVARPRRLRLAFCLLSGCTAFGGGAALFWLTAHRIIGEVEDPESILVLAVPLVLGTAMIAHDGYRLARWYESAAETTDPA